MTYQKGTTRRRHGETGGVIVTTSASITPGQTSPERPTTNASASTWAATGSSVPSTTIDSSDLVGLRPSADCTSGGDPFEPCKNVSTSQQIHLGNSGQHMGSALDEQHDENDNKTTIERDKKGPAATGKKKTHQGSCRPGPCKGKAQARQPPPASLFTRHSSKIQKPTTSRPDRKAARTIAQGSPSRGAVQQTWSSQRLTRRSVVRGTLLQCYGPPGRPSKLPFRSSMVGNLTWSEAGGSDVVYMELTEGRFRRYGRYPQGLAGLGAAASNSLAQLCLRQDEFSHRFG